jgi:VCBS repeat-containing protein
LKRTSKPFWERAYKGHAFWLGKTKLGKVTLAEKGKYTWEAAGRAGEAEELEKAKKAVEQAVLLADKQMDLFR